MTTVKKCLCICLGVLIGTGLFGCGMVQQAVDDSDPESNRLLTAFLDALNANDADAAYQLLFPGIMDRSDFDESWTVLARDWKYSSDYTYQRQSVRTNISTSGKSVDNVYIVSREDCPDYIVSLSRAEKDGQSGITFIAIEIYLVSFGGSAN